MNTLLLPDNVPEQAQRQSPPEAFHLSKRMFHNTEMNPEKFAFSTIIYYF